MKQDLEKGFFSSLMCKNFVGSYIFLSTTGHPATVALNDPVLDSTLHIPHPSRARHMICRYWRGVSICAGFCLLIGSLECEHPKITCHSRLFDSFSFHFINMFVISSPRALLFCIENLYKNTASLMSRSYVICIT